MKAEHFFSAIIVLINLGLDKIRSGGDDDIRV